MSTSPNPTAPATPANPALGFVNTLALCGLLLGVLTILLSMLLGLFSLLISPEAVDLSFQMLGQAAPPAWLRWVFTHLASLCGWGLLSSGVLCWLSLGLQKRREYARLGYVVLMYANALLHLAPLFFIQQLRQAIAPLFALLPIPIDANYLEQVVLSSVVSGVVFAIGFAWAGWKLSAAPVRALFRSTL